MKIPALELLSPWFPEGVITEHGRKSSLVDFLSGRDVQWLNLFVGIESRKGNATAVISDARSEHMIKSPFYWDEKPFKFKPGFLNLFTMPMYTYFVLSEASAVGLNLQVSRHGEVHFQVGTTKRLEGIHPLWGDLDVDPPHLYSLGFELARNNPTRRNPRRRSRR